jgi:hypothetical protein
VEGNARISGHLEDERTVFAATEVHCRLTLKVRFARNQSTNKNELIFAVSETEATCRMQLSRQKRMKPAWNDGIPSAGRKDVTAHDWHDARIEIVPWGLEVI